MDFNDNELSRMSKRRFLKVASAAGVSASCLAYGTQEGLVRAADENEVPYVAYLRGDPGNRDPIYKSIARDKWGDRHTARKLAQRMKRRLTEKYGYKEAGTYWGPMDESPTGWGVKVFHRTVYGSDGELKRQTDPSPEELRDFLPNKGSASVAKGEYKERRSHIPIRVKEREETEAACTVCDTSREYFACDWSFVPGGDSIYHTSEGKDATNTAAYSDGQGYEGWIGSGHPATVGETVLLDGTNDNWKFGVTQNVNDGADIDYCFIRKDYGKESATAIRYTDQCSKEYSVYGIVKNSELANKEGSDSLYTQGWRTGRNFNQIRNLEADYDAVEMENEVGCGDSGGPLFEIRNTYEAYIAGTIVRRVKNGGEDGDSCGDDSLCTTAETIESKEGGGFLTT